MKLQDQLNQLQSQMQQLESQKQQLIRAQQNCKHQWSPAVYNPYNAQEEYLTGAYETHGVHMWPLTSSRLVTKPRWTKTCSECGLEKHTEKQRPSQTLEPDFD